MISKKEASARVLNGQKSINDAVKAICDIMRRGNVTSAVYYVPELTWILFLRVLDEMEENDAAEAEAVGAGHRPSLVAPYRWRDWAAPDGAHRKILAEDGHAGDFFAFVNDQLLPYLKGLEEQPDAGVRQKVISEIVRGVERVQIDTERNLLDVLDRVDGLSYANIDATHVFGLSQVYEGLLLKMGEKNNDGGQFFTPREVIRAMVRVIDPQIDETVYDPGCGTCGFLAQGFEHIKSAIDAQGATAAQYSTLKQDTFFGREKENLIYPVALANLVLHGIDHPRLWHGNTLTGREDYGGLYKGAPELFDVILSNPPFGGKEGKEAQTRFDYKTGSTQVLFVQHVLAQLKNGGRCAIVVDEGLLFRTSEEAFVKTKRKPLTLAQFEDFFQHLPERADSELSWTVDFDARKKDAAREAAPLHAEAEKTGQSAAQWKERLAELKKAPRKSRDAAAIEEAEVQIKTLTREARALSAKAQDIENAVYDLKAVNPNRQSVVDTRTPEELLDIIEAQGVEIDAALAELRASL